MIVFNPIQTSFTVHKNTFLLHTPKLPISRNSFFCLCQSNTSDSTPSTPPPEGDPQKQEILARIAQLQTQKLRLTGFLDEKSADLTQFAEEADAEFEKIGEDALRGLDEASARVGFMFRSFLSFVTEICGFEYDPLLVFFFLFLLL